MLTSQWTPCQNLNGHVMWGMLAPVGPKYWVSEYLLRTKEDEGFRHDKRTRTQWYSFEPTPILKRFRLKFRGDKVGQARATRHFLVSRDDFLSPR